MSEKIIKVLGIESSCDDTAVAIIDSTPKIISNIIINQNGQHSPYAGVVPEIAARAHLDNIEYAIDKALQQGRCSLQDIDAIAATCGPGLIGGVIVSSMYGKALSSSLGKPFIAINHLEGHALTAQLTDQVPFPYLLLLASGGHSQFILVHSLGRYEFIGGTIDDAIGEAFDKVAKMMGLGFPGGALIEQIATKGDDNRFDFPKPLYHCRNADMSFSGLKTAVRLQIDKISPLTENDMCDIAASFQRVVADILVQKTEFAMSIANESLYGWQQPKYFVMSGGVAANKILRANLSDFSHKMGYNFVAPPAKLCTDNAAMIGFAGLLRLQNGLIDDISFKPRAKWPLNEM